MEKILPNRNYFNGRQDLDRKRLPEQILCAAIWYKEIPVKKEKLAEMTLPYNCDKGLVITGHRHGQCYRRY